MSSSETPILRRRNGRPQACEPCRKRKVACDHAQPVCNRCVKRKQRGDCVYVVPSPEWTASSPRRLLSPGANKSPSARRSTGSSAQAPARRANRPEKQLSRPAAVKPGYLGFTSFSAVYEETEHSLSRIQGSHPTTPQPGGLDDVAGASAPSSIPSRTLDKCLFVLRNVPDPAKGKLCFRSRPTEVWMYKLARDLLESIYVAFGHQYLAHNRADSALEDLSRILCSNTAKSFSDDEVDPGPWKDQFFGPNARWEALGLLFCFWDLSLSTTNKFHGASWDESSTAASAVANECLGQCIELSHEFSTGNSLLLYLCHRRVILESVVTGDANLRAWMYHAETVSLLTFLGYHALDNPKPYQPSFTTEFKRRLYHNVYTIAMVLVSFTGRPPLLSRRFASTPLPLDFQDMFVDHRTLIEASKTLNEHGWNAQGHYYHTTSSMRARAILATVREELFEHALGHERCVPVEKLIEIRDREMAMFGALPDSLKYHAGDVEDPSIEIHLLSARLVLQLDHLQNMFFAERLLQRHGCEQNNLLAVSFDMLSFALPFWVHHDRLYAMRSDCEWLVMAYGVPAGGILCQELLKPTLHASPPTNPNITRSSIIQKLSLLSGFLDWIKPNAPNADLCFRCKTIIQHVLDQALNTTPVAPGAFNTLDWDFSTQVDFDFDLLDTFDWTRPDNPDFIPPQ
ncbi:hypothetical protein F4780DRAFT_202842 [Xylariomycetidae sp. FL0641]|nr:hypothetical protein F4780DRAFT_202842 [Xylariomycetidae sp. FL0641]